MMRLQDWESEIDQIINECRHGQLRVDTVLKEWRAKLEQEPALLKPFEIDVIMREVQKRLGDQ